MSGTGNGLVGNRIIKLIQIDVKETKTKLSVECNSMVSIAAFNPGDPGSNPGLFAVLNSNQKLTFKKNTSMWFSSRYCNPVTVGTLVGGDK